MLAQARLFSPAVLAGGSLRVATPAARGTVRMGGTQSPFTVLQGGHGP